MARKKIKTSNIFEDLSNKKMIPILTEYDPFRKLIEFGASKKMQDLIEKLNETIIEEKENILAVKNLDKEKKRSTAKVLYYSKQINSPSGGLRSDIDNLEKERQTINNMYDEIDSRKEKIDELSIEKENLNLDLLKETISYCYNNMDKDEKDLDVILKEIDKLRDTLEEKRIKRDDLEGRINSTYSFIHSLLGAKATQSIDTKLIDDNK